MTTSGDIQVEVEVDENDANTTDHTNKKPILINNEQLGKLFALKPELAEYVFMELENEQIA